MKTLPQGLKDKDPVVHVDTQLQHHNPILFEISTYLQRKMLVDLVIAIQFEIVTRVRYIQIIN